MNILQIKYRLKLMDEFGKLPKTGDVHLDVANFRLGFELTLNYWNNVPTEAKEAVAADPQNGVIARPAMPAKNYSDYISEYMSQLENIVNSNLQ